MNVSFSLPNDKTRRDDNSLQPYRIVSLWEVLQFCAHAFVNISWTLAEMSGNLESFKKEHPEVDRLATKQLILAGFHQPLGWLLEHLDELKLEMSAKAMRRFVDYVGDPEREISIDEVRSRIEKIRERLQDEFETRMLFITESANGRFYRKGKEFLGEDILAEFPALEEEVNEAAACFAVARYTSCAFHLTRIMEHVVHQFARKLDFIPDPNEDTWGVILDRVKQKIDKWDKDRKRPSPTKKKYLACYKSIDGIRPRRDDLVHHRDYYTEERVDDLKGRVKSCIEDYLELPDWKPLYSKEARLRLVNKNSKIETE